MSKVYSLQRTQFLPTGLDKAWDFFSRPSNLAHITPTSMKFKVLGEQFGDAMYAGQVIEYTVRPMLSIPVYWMTEITHVQDQQFFVDEQRFGPFSFWHHQHQFKSVPGGVEMTDIIHYKIPYWFFGDIANALFVRKQLYAIFDFRFKVAEDLFGNK